MEKEFVIKYVKDGTEFKETYIYDFNKLTMDRIFTAEQLFLVNAEFYQKQNVPGNPQQLTKEMERLTFLKAIKSLLMKKTDTGFAEYNPEDNDLSLFKHMTGDNYDSLMEIKEDFFTRSKMLSNISVMQSLDLIGKLAKELDSEQFKLVMETYSDNPTTFAKRGKK